MNAILDRARTLPGRVTLLALAMVAAAALGFGSPEYLVQQWTLWLIFGVLAVSLTFIWGSGGIFSFGQGAMFGIGGYAYGVASINLSPVTGETFSSLLIGGTTAAVFALVLGYFMFYGNVGELYVGIITLAVTLALLTFMSSTGSPEYAIGTAQLGGYNGMVGIPGLGTLVAPFDTSTQFLFVAAVAGVTVLALDTLLRRPFGRALVAVRDNELRTQLLGYDVRRIRLTAFVIGGFIAGIAGGEFAAWGLFMNPATFGLAQAAILQIWVLVGGRKSLLGAFLGAAIIQQLQSSLGASGGNYTQIILGAVLIFIVLLAPEGLMSGVFALLRRAGLRVGRTAAVAARVADDDQTAAAPTDSEPVGQRGQLEVVDATKHFGGVKALRGVSASFQPRTVTSLLGPNGAGKSTFFNVVIGRYPVTSGTISLDGHDVTRLSMHRRAQLGMGIKLQVPSVYNELPALENVWLAAYARHREVALADQVTRRVLAEFGLEDVADVLVGEFSHGQRQWLEIAMVVAGEPRIILLDEPTAGMTRAETSRTAELVTRLGTRATVVVVEHDMEFVRQLDSHAIMFHEGSILTSGTIEELRANEQVLDIYLGRAITK